MWDPAENVVRGNVVEGSGEADIVVGSGRRPIEELDNCVEGNAFATSRPAAIETLDPERAPAMAAIDMPPRFDTAAVEARSGPRFTTGR